MFLIGIHYDSLSQTQLLIPDTPFREEFQFRTERKYA